MASSATAPNSLSFFSSSLFLSSSHQIPKTYISVSKFGSGKASKPLSVASQLATLPIAPTETKQVDGDDSDGFKTASEREISDEEGEEHDRVNDAVTSQEEPQHSDKPEKKEELIELMREGEVITDDGPKQEKAMAEANEAKVEGNKLFVNGLYEEALSKYVLALELVQEFPESIELRSICHLNRGVCFLKLSKYEETIKECTKALELNPTYTKALVRRAEAHETIKTMWQIITLRLCYRHIEKQRSSESLKALHSLFDTTHIDNMKILTVLIHPKPHITPLQDGMTKRKVHLDVLRRKTVLLLISDVVAHL